MENGIFLASNIKFHLVLEYYNEIFMKIDLNVLKGEILLRFKEFIGILFFRHLEYLICYVMYVDSMQSFGIPNTLNYD